MNFVPVITHAVAILIGWLVVSFATLPDPGLNGSAGHPATHPPRTFRSAASDHRPSPASLLEAQAGITLDPGLRTMLKRRILSDWATTDPDGLLLYLDQRPWLDGWENAADMALATLARTRPADLLAYAKSEGCPLAITALCDHGDPRVVLDLLLALPAGSIFPAHLARVFERGCQLDPGFHGRFDVIESPEARLQVFQRIAATLLADRRDGALYPWLAKQADTLPSDFVGTVVARQLLAMRSDVQTLEHLPDASRADAIHSFLRALVTDPVHGDESYQRSCFTTFLQNGWLDGHLDLATAVIMEYHQGGSRGNQRRKAATGWKDWALTLPNDPKWDSLRRTAIRRWALTEPDRWNSFVDLPTQDLRNAAYAAVVHAIDFEQNGEHISWIINQITEPALRNVAAEVITARMESDPGGPFAAADIDPFQPLGHR